MLKPFYLILIIFFHVSSIVHAQNRLPVSGDFTTDVLNNIYIFNNNSIKMYNNNTKQKFIYSNNNLGKINYIDTYNAHKVLVFYKDFGKIVTLDNTLSPNNNVIDLMENGYENVNLVCKSYNDGFWLYNSINFELIRKDVDFNTTNQSGNLANLLRQDITPSYIIEYNNKVYLNDTLKGIYVFDVYGTYIKTIPIVGIKEFQVKDKQIIFSTTKNTIGIYNLFTLEQTEYKSDVYYNVKKVRVENNYIFIQTSKNELIIEKLAY